MKKALYVFLGGWLASAIPASEFFGMTCSGWDGLYCLFGAGLILMVTQAVAAIYFLSYVRTSPPGTDGRWLAVVLGLFSGSIALALLTFVGAVVTR